MGGYYSKLIFEKGVMVICFNIGVEIVDFSKFKRSCVRYWRTLNEILSKVCETLLKIG